LVWRLEKLAYVYKNSLNMGVIINKALEDFMLGTFMDSEKTGEIVSREEIFKKLKGKAITK